MSDKEDIEKLKLFIQQSNDKQTQEIKVHIEKEITEIRKIVEEEKAKRNELEEKYTELKEKYSILEKSLRKNNIIIFGIQTNVEAALVENTLDVLNHHLKLDLNKKDVNNIYTIGKQTQNKPIIVKLASFLTKVNILKAAKNLKGTGIVISEELTLEERKRNKILRQYLIEARKKGQTASIKNGTLHVNGETYTAKQLSENVLDTDGETVEDDEDQNHINTGKQLDPKNLKKRQNNPTEERKEDITQSDPKKIKITAFVPRSSPRLNDKEEKEKNNTPKNSAE